MTITSPLAFETMPAPPMQRPRLKLAARPALIYAVGDVHGCLDQLKTLEASIVADAAGVAGQKLIVMLGDYVDRGPQSAQTITWLQQPPPEGFERICLFGNHESLFEAALTDPTECTDWLNWGGMQTLQSYSIHPGRFRGAPAPDRVAMLRDQIPDGHRDFLRSRPTMLSVPGYVFVHAGIRGGIALEQQVDEDLIWIRKDFLHTPLSDMPVVVHGHTPRDKPEDLGWRIGVDTRCFDSGRLTAVRIDSSGTRSFLST